MHVDQPNDVTCHNRRGFQPQTLFWPFSAGDMSGQNGAIVLISIDECAISKYVHNVMF